MDKINNKSGLGWENKLLPCSKNKYIIKKLKDKAINSRKEKDVLNTLHTLNSNNVDNSIISWNLNNNYNDNKGENNFKGLDNMNNSFNIMHTDNSTHLKWDEQIQLVQQSDNNKKDLKHNKLNNDNNAKQFKHNKNIDNISQSEVPREQSKLNFDMSVLSCNLEDINNYIEENYNLIMSENSYLRRDFHSIIFFLILPCSEIHRICLSDYEIKIIEKSFISKGKINRIDGMDYYRLGLISVYKNRFYEAFARFYKARQLRQNNYSIRKWLAFCGLLILFGHEGKAVFTYDSLINFNPSHETSNEPFSTKDFRTMSNHSTNNKKHDINKNLEEDSVINNQNNNVNYKINLLNKNKYNETTKTNTDNNVNNKQDEEIEEESTSDGLFFSCCTTRKGKTKEKFNIIKFSTMSNLSFNFSLKNNDYYNNNTNNILYQFALFEFTLTKKDIINEVEDCLKTNILPEAKQEKDLLESWWLIMIISIFKHVNTRYSSLFSFNYDPKFCIKKIKEVEVYYSYLSYIDYLELTKGLASDHGSSNDKIINNSKLLNKQLSISTTISKKSRNMIINILSELIAKFPFKLEAYLKYWYIFAKGDLLLRNREKAAKISELLWKSSFKLNFDDLSY
jgi:hypothetical protein